MQLWNNSLSLRLNLVVFFIFLISSGNWLEEIMCGRQIGWQDEWWLITGDILTETPCSERKWLLPSSPTASISTYFESVWGYQTAQLLLSSLSYLKQTNRRRPPRSIYNITLVQSDARFEKKFLTPTFASIAIFVTAGGKLEQLQISQAYLFVLFLFCCG